VTQVVDRVPVPPSPPLPPAPAAPGADVAAGAAPGTEEERAGSGPMVRLNAFQVLMRRWSKMHPYNAGQVMRVSGVADRERWKGAVEAVVGELGLGRPRFSNGDLAAQFVPVEEVAVEPSDRDLECFFNEELNRPFAAGDLPIRFCILPAGEQGGEASHYLAAVYDHWIADSRGMRELMHRIFERFQQREGPAAGGGTGALTLEAPPFVQLYRKHIGRLTRVAALRESLKNIWRHRHAYRLNLWKPLDFTSRLVMRELPAGTIERLYRFAKARGASVNDLFIAAIGQAMGAYTAEHRLGRAKRMFHFARREIGIGTIVDIREAASEPLDRVFNLYLSSYTVLLDSPEKQAIDEVTREVAAETKRIKKSSSTVKSFWALVMARFWYDVYDTPRFQATLLHKSVPVVAGISNVNMTGSWVDEKPGGGGGHVVNGQGNGQMHGQGREAHGEGPRVLDYLRISPAGPLIPLVFTLTTIGGRLSLCVTYRTQAFHEERLKMVVNDFVRRLEEVG